MARRKEPIAILPGGIEIISVRRMKRYNYATIAAHPLFNSKISRSGRMVVGLSRVVMTSLLNRELDRNEHVHHGKRGQFVDVPSNLSLLSAADHNRHHKTGTKHTAKTKAKIAAGLALAIAEGRKTPTRLFGKNNPFFGKHHTKETRAIISATNWKHGKWASFSL